MKSVDITPRPEEPDNNGNRSGIPCAVIITALKEECQAVTAHLSNLKEGKDRYNNIYDCGYFEGAAQTWKVVVAEIGVGNITAAIKVSSAVNHFNPDVLLLVGVAGGLKDEISLGSVIASTKIYGYQAGKADESFLVRPEIAYSDWGLEQRAKATARKDIWIRRIINPQFSADTPPEAHVKPIAAGDQVVSSTNSPTFKLLRDHYSDAVAVEMEGYGVLCAARETGVPSIVIRGISDKVDDKDKVDKIGWQKKAASHASAFAFEMLANYTIIIPKSLLDSGGFEVGKRPVVSHGRQVEKLIPKKEENETDISDLIGKFYTASKPLLNWPCTLDGSKWLERKEFQQIIGIINTHSESSTILLGEPGSGKSSLLAKLAHYYSVASIPILAIKADELDVDINSQLKLAEYLQLTTTPESCVRMVAQTRSIIVFIDQLDALADLVDLKSERLNVLLDFIHELSDTENVHVICSCRTFEFHHDFRLNSISAENITLDLPQWEDIATTLVEKGIDAGNWPQHFRDILRTPQHLKIFLSLLRGPNEYDLFETYHAMLDQFWEREVTGKKVPKGYSEFVKSLAYHMAEEESLWLPLIRYEKKIDIIQNLERAGILVRSLDGRRIGFRHQTIMDYAAARSFIQEKTSLAQYVFERQNALFVRPRLWNTLIYLRNADPRAYKREFTTLWEAQNLRLHVRYLLIEFLGKIDFPDEQEANWLLDYIDNPHFRDKALLALAGNKEWFNIIADKYLPGLMSDIPEKCSNICVVLERALPFAKDKVVELLKKHWLPDPSRDPLVLQILSELGTWEENSFKLVCEIFTRTEIGGHYLMHIVSLVSASTPDLAPKIIALALNKSLQEQMRNTEGDSKEEAISGTMGIANDRVKRILEQQDYYDLPAIAEAAPLSFLNEVWPWFIKLLDCIISEEHPLVVGYRTDYSLATQLSSEDRRGREYPILLAIERAIIQLAATMPNEFLQFLHKWESADYLVVQRLLARGLLKMASTYPAECLRFLTFDPRRMVLETDLSEHFSETEELIKACVTYLNEEQVRQLEEFILEWKAYKEFPNDDIKTRFERKKRDRLMRLNLLKAFPLDKLSTKGQLLVSKEERVFGDDKGKRVMFTGVHTVESPMSSGQMAKAKDLEILRLFSELTDDTEWDHPRRDRVFSFLGGSIQASRSFAEFAKENINRALVIIRQFPLCNQRPAGYALRAIAETDYPSENLFELIEELDQKGFNSLEFVTSAAETLSRRAKPPVGLPPSICILLEKWLFQLPWNDKEEDKTEETIKEDSSESILWRYGGFGVIPQGTYTIIEALTRAYLMRHPMDHGKWLEMLENHLERSDSTRTWRAVAMWQLKYIQNCEKERAVKFLRQLFLKYPSVLHGRAGVFLIANLRWWLPRESMWDYLISIKDSDWVHGFQAYGELLFLNSMTFEDDVRSKKEIETFLTNFIKEPSGYSKIGLGFAYAAAHLWGDYPVRDRVTNIMVQMIPYLDKAQSKAIMEVFRLTDPLIYDDATLKLLDAICKNPRMIRFGGDSFLIDRMQDLLPAKPEIVFRVSKSFVEALKDQIIDIRTSLYASAQELVNTALTLQRYEGKNREQGLELFEMLLELNAYGAKSTLDELDGRPINVTHRPARRRRRKGK